MGRFGKKRASSAGGSGQFAKKRKRKQRGRIDDSADEGGLEEGSFASAAVAAAVDADLRAEREAEASGEPEASPQEAMAEVSIEPAQTENDPYLLADAKYIEKDTRWRNKQRTLVFCSRGVTSRYRHLCEDIRKMLPHHKAEAKFEKKSNLHEINEVCELKSCNNVVFFETRKREDLYMWLARVPTGPTIKFQVLNVHTTSEVRLAGNCLLGSRPILYFDRHFDDMSFLRLIKGLLTQAFGTPRNHPKSKPFHDHVMSFYWLDKKIWFRHYQISPETPGDCNDPEKQVLTEIGPRFVLDPIRVFGGSFSGQTLYANAFYMSPTALRSQAKKLLKNPYKQKLDAKADRKARVEANELPPDPLNEAFV